MSAIEVKVESVVTVRMPAEYAAKLCRSLARTFAAFDGFTPAERDRLINASTVDDLLAFKMAIEARLPVEPA